MLGVLLAAVNLFAQTFAGSWTCHAAVPATADRPAHTTSVPWSIQAAPGDRWTIVRWGAQDGSGGGVAYVGFVPSQNDWAFQDFHYDGSFGVSTSAGPGADGVWTWAGGAYYTSAGILHGTATWKLSSPTRIDRTFTRMTDGKPQNPSSDYCIKQ